MKKWIAAITVWLSLNQLFGLGKISPEKPVALYRLTASYIV